MLQVKIEVARTYLSNGLESIGLIPLVLCVSQANRIGISGTQTICYRLLIFVLPIVHIYFLAYFMP